MNTTPLHRVKIVILSSEEDEMRHSILFGETEINLAVVPRVGEYLVVSGAATFEVVAVLHVTDPEPGETYLELRVRFAGDELELFQRLKRPYQTP